MRIAIVGGGISGLATACFLERAGHDVVCLEPSAHPGGAIRSERRGGFLCETGPQAILEGAPETSALIAELGLDARVVRAAPAVARRRFIYVRGALRPVPAGPAALLRSDTLNLAAKLRLLAEPLVPRGPAARDAAGAADESVLDFGRRRLGDGAATALLAPAVIGVFAGDAARLSVRSAFPRLYAFERQHGSLLRGFLKSRRSGQLGAGRLMSFRDGLGELPRALAARLGPRLMRASVGAIARAGARWRLDLDADPACAAVDSDAVVVAASPRATATLLSPLAPAAAAAVRAVPMAPVAVACLGFHRPPDGVDLRAYGFLVARGERPTLLGCQYESSIFPGRAPPGAVLIRAILGGTFAPTVVAESDDAIVAVALSDLRRAVGLRGDPDFVAVWRHQDAIPQYELGHADRVAAVDADVAHHAGLHVLGYALRGVGVNDCIQAAADLARRIGPAA